MLITGLLIGAALGFVLQRGRFCVTGAFRDVWIAKNTWWLSAFFVAIAVQAVGIWVLNALGVITLEASAFPWLATIVGGPGGRARCGSPAGKRSRRASSSPTPTTTASG